MFSIEVPFLKIQALHVMLVYRFDLFARRILLSPYTYVYACTQRNDMNKLGPFFFLSMLACRSRVVSINQVNTTELEPSVEPGEEPSDDSSEGGSSSDGSSCDGSSTEDSSDNSSVEPSNEPSAPPSEEPSNEPAESDVISGVPGCDFGTICYSFTGAEFSGSEEASCDQINDYYQSQDPNIPIGQYVEGGCPAETFGYCHIADPPEYYVYFYPPYPVEDAEYACEDSGGFWASL